MQLSGKKLDLIRRTFLESIEECKYRSPSVLLVDDIDSICRRIPTESVMASERNYLTRYYSCNTWFIYR